jgi:hypothetical protein
VREHSYAELAAKPSTPAEDLAAQRFVCRGCGAHLQGDAVSQRCQFCTAALVVDTDSDVQIPPEAVLPFTLDRAGPARRWSAGRSHACSPRTASRR